MSHTLTCLLDTLSFTTCRFFEEGLNKDFDFTVLVFLVTRRPSPCKHRVDLDRWFDESKQVCISRASAHIWSPCAAKEQIIP
jgi:hypothetical protein